VKRSIFVLIALLALGLVVLGACGGEDTTATTAAGGPATTAPATETTGAGTETTAPATETTTAAGPVETLKVGFGAPLTLPIGTQLQQLFESVVEDFNAKGGLTVQGTTYNIELITYDESFTTDGGKAAAERWVNQDGVKHVLSAVGGPAVLGEISVTDPAGVMLVSGAAINPFIGPDTKYTMRGISYVTSIIKWRYALEKYPEIKTIVHLGIDDQLGHAEGDVLDIIAGAMGLTVTKHIYFPDTTTDFSSIAASALALDPDIIDMDGIQAPGVLGRLTKALYQAGWTGPKIAQELDPIVDIDAGGAEAMEGFITVFADTTQLEDVPAIAANVKAVYTAKYTDWIPSTAKWIDSFYLWVNAVQKADSLDPAEIQAALAEGMTYEGFLGPYMLIKRPDMGVTRYCDVLSQTAVGEVQGGKVVPVKVFSPDEGIAAVEAVYGFAGEWK
jgi:branched-chain amino acid transport system substrate-binding protein